ncbi:MAG: hypothetical protein QNJ63_30470 [Calothrix sp. MO_192.B10]|nr:hypothetical protein [Calothrix sp. MO_192.B10]
MLSHKSELFVEISEEQQEVVAGGLVIQEALDAVVLKDEQGSIGQGAFANNGFGFFPFFGGPNGNASGFQSARNIKIGATSVRKQAIA